MNTTINKNEKELLARAEEMNNKIEEVAKNLDHNWNTYKNAARQLGYTLVNPYTKKGYKVPENCLVYSPSFNPTDNIFVKVEISALEKLEKLYSNLCLIETQEAIFNTEHSKHDVIDELDANMNHPIYAEFLNKHSYAAFTLDDIITDADYFEFGNYNSLEDCRKAFDRQINSILKEIRKTLTSENTRNYDLLYKRENYKAYTFRLDKHNDEAMIKYLETIKEKTEYIKDLIEKDMKSKKQ